MEAIKDLREKIEEAVAKLGISDQCITFITDGDPVVDAIPGAIWPHRTSNFSHVTVDIASPPSGKLSLFNCTLLYQGAPDDGQSGCCKSLMVFFLEAHELEMILEDERLDKLDETTKLWWQRLSNESNT